MHGVTHVRQEEYRQDQEKHTTTMFFSVVSILLIVEEFVCLLDLKNVCRQ
uniref:Uncharacterized protein n=1 Tax=Arion vulgaris TaxID=1028688 RepID=A0A0B6ZYJ0_9EUPU